MLREFFYSLMTDRRKGQVYLPLTALMRAVSLFYGAGLTGRRILYRLGIFRSERVPLKVVSVGNLTLGGTGKTPFTVMLASLVRSELRREAAVLIRGYGWDEQAMLKKLLPDNPILVGEDRAHSADRAIKLYGTSIAILDDGFQHWELARDLDIVLVDAANPFGNGMLFPRGLLREPVAALRRADVIVLTKVDRAGADIAGLRRYLENVAPEAHILKSAHRPQYFYDSRARKELPLTHIKGKRVLCVSSIGDPASFGEMVTGLGAVIADTLVFPDHYNYAEGDRAAIEARAAASAVDAIVTTEKDAVKFARMSFTFGKVPALTLAIALEITEGKEILIARLYRLLRR